MPKEDISAYNSTWGICGFTSALTHLYDSDIRLRGKIDLSTPKAIRQGLLIEVLTFLKYVRAFRGDLIDGLNELNTALNSPSMGNGIVGFIPLAEGAIRANAELIGNAYQCALTPEALTLYLQKMCGLTGAKMTKGADPGSQGILGLLNARGELVHWVYRDANQYVYNWGDIISPQDWPTHGSGLGHAQLSSVGYHVSFS